MPTVKPAPNPPSSASSPICVHLCNLWLLLRVLFSHLSSSSAGSPRRPSPIWAYLWLLLCFITTAAAQTAPAGNAHPQEQSLSQSTGEVANPFGAPSDDNITATDKKRALAAGVDLEPLRTLAVLHDGRVKIIDTLAKETVQQITGRSSYFDTRPTADGHEEKLKYAPMFTFFDLLIDPGYYLDKPLIHVEYLPLRERYLEAAFPGDEKQQERWKRLTRLTPVMVIRYGEAIEDKYGAQGPYRDGLNKVLRAMGLYREGVANLLMVAPAQKDDPYTHLGALPADSPARIAAGKLGAAWRAGDPAGVNAAVKVLAAELPKINAASYPTTSRKVEYAYNKANAFEWGFWAYLIALISLVLAFGTGRKWLVGVGITTLMLAVCLHGFGFITRCIIAERFAIQNQFESMTGLSLFATIVGSAIMLLRRQWLFGAAAAGVGFLVLVAATQLPIIPGKFIEREAAILNTSILLKYHVTTVLCSYGLISLGFICSLFYLGTHYAAKARASVKGSAAGNATTMATTALNLDSTKPAGTARTLSDLDKAQLVVLQLAFWTLGVGILLGAWWADHSWGRFWNFDPKETWALATWIIYLIVIHVRLTTGHNRGLVTAWLSVLGFIVMLWTYFGVNLILPGLHAYA